MLFFSISSRKKKIGNDKTKERKTVCVAFAHKRSVAAKSGTRMCVFATFLIVLVKYLLFVLFIFCWFLYFLQDVLKPLLDIALDISQLQKLTGRDAPTVIT